MQNLVNSHRAVFQVLHFTATKDFTYHRAMLDKKRVYKNYRLRIWGNRVFEEFNQINIPSILFKFLKFESIKAGK
jgi:hypothetical protein